MVLLLENSQPDPPSPHICIHEEKSSWGKLSRKENIQHQATLISCYGREVAANAGLEVGMSQSDAKSSLVVL